MNKHILEELKNVLRANGEKITPARTALLEVFINSTQLKNASEIYDILKVNGFKINYSTVYRNLNTLSKNNLIEKISFNDEIKYKLVDLEKHSHHLICKSCNKTELLNYCPFNTLEEIIKKETNFTPLEHKFEIYGYCKDCKPQNKNN